MHYNGFIYLYNILYIKSIDQLDEKYFLYRFFTEKKEIKLIVSLLISLERKILRFKEFIKLITLRNPHKKASTCMYIIYHYVQ